MEKGLARQIVTKDAAWLLRQTPSSIGNVTLQQATSTDSYPIRKMVKDHGEQVASTWIGLVLEEADLICGGKNPPHVLALFGRMLMQGFGHRSVESIVVAIRDGLSRKVYGALTYPQIAEWMNDHEAAVIALVESEAGQHKFTGDNLGAAFLDRMEHESTPATIRRQQNLINSLRAKLSNNGGQRDEAK